MEEAQLLASENGKKVFIFGKDSWSNYSNKMRDEVFSEKAVIDSIKSYFYPVRVDIESNKMIRQAEPNAATVCTRYEGLCHTYLLSVG